MLKVIKIHIGAHKSYLVFQFNPYSFLGIVILG